MLTKGIKKYLANPMIGLLPFIVYILLQIYVLPTPIAIGISLALVFAGEFALRKFFGGRIHTLTFYMTATALIVISILWFFGRNWISRDCTYILVGEVAVVIQLMIARLLSPFLKARYSTRQSFIDKALINDFFLTSNVLKYALTIHIFGVLIFKQITEGYYNAILDHIIYITIPILIILSLFAYHVYKTNYLVKKLRMEEWLPIVTENGEVTGRIAKAVSKNLKNEHMHPVVRVALICNKKIYLQERDDKYILDAGKIDHPFEKYMLFRHEVNQATLNSIKRILGRKPNKEPNFIFKYVFKNDITKRLIFLYTVTIDDESLVTKTQKMTGKFWTVKQIDEEFGDGIFGECFELEYEYLKHMILLEDADTLIAKDSSNDSIKLNADL